uniref:Uncharacterized protein n=2 Tax=Panagrolaimus sp. ES5 TaxID=591445 RepID=A0AC34GFT8_9BILA
MTYFCRIIFKSFNSDQVNEFLEHCIGYEWQTIDKFTILEGENRITGDEVELFDEKLEKKFSFELKQEKEDDEAGAVDKYESLTLAFCELSMIFKRFEEVLRKEYRSVAMTVILTIISRNISPQRFE